MIKYEHLVLYHYQALSGVALARWEWLPAHFKDRDEQEVLDDLGSKGWELVACTPNYLWQPSEDLKSPGMMYFLKRRAS